MAIAENVNLKSYCQDVAERAKKASAELARGTGAQKINWLRRSAKMLREHTAEILEANKRDLAAAPGFGLTDAEIDRLKLNTGRIEGIASALEQIAALPESGGRGDGIVDSAEWFESA